MNDHHPLQQTEGEAKSVVLQRVRSALWQTSVLDRATAAWDDLPRGYRQTSEATRDEVLHLLTDRLRDYDSGVHRCAPGDIAATVELILLERGSPRMLVPQGLPSHWLPASLAFTADEAWSSRELDRFEGIVTGTMLAIAETGTLVLQAVRGQGRRAATLVPDYHLCVVYANDAVATVPEAMQRLAATRTLPTTFVSGPSATADIEMTRIKGVHGPRFLDVVLVD